MLMVSKFDLAAQLQSVRRVVLVALLLLALAVLAMGLAARAGRGASAAHAAGPRAHHALLADGPNAVPCGGTLLGCE
ncbi:MAG TPA: hypothetical protein VIC85_10380 [Ktedonobacterales bacterium]